MKDDRCAYGMFRQVLLQVVAPGTGSRGEACIPFKLEKLEYVSCNRLIITPSAV